MKTSEKITSAIQDVISGLPSQYILAETEHGDTIKIRVSNHMANPGRMDSDDLSLVVLLPEKPSEEEETSQFRINKKTFRNIPGQWFLNESGDFIEQFESVEAFLEWYNIKNQ